MRYNPFEDEEREFPQSNSSKYIVMENQMAERAKKAPKWTDETVQVLRDGYVAGNAESVKELVEVTGKSPREVIGKLVNLGIYKVPEKAAKQPKDEGPTKAEILTAIQETGKLETKGFEGATKSALVRLQTLVG